MKHIHGGGGGEIECRLSVVVANGPECLFRYRAKRRVTRWCRVIRVIRNFSFSLQLEGNHALFDRITCFFLFIVDWITEPPLSGFFSVSFFNFDGLVVSSVLTNHWFAARWGSIVDFNWRNWIIEALVRVGCWLDIWWRYMYISIKIRRILWAWELLSDLKLNIKNHSLVIDITYDKI